MGKGALTVPGIPWAAVCLAVVEAAARPAKPFSVHAQELGSFWPLTIAEPSV